MIVPFQMGVIASALKIPVAGGPISDLLLHFEGSTFVDSGIHAMTVSLPTSGATLSTAQQKFGAKSCFINTGCLGVTHAALALGTGDFSFEAWVYMTSSSGQQFFYDQRDPNGGCVYHMDGALNFYDGQTGNNLAYSGSTISLNTWHHVEVNRHAGVIYLFLDGVLGGTMACTSALDNTTWIIGAGQYFPVGVAYFMGYMDEVRIVAGASQHTTSFTPPTAPYTP